MITSSKNAPNSNDMAKRKFLHDHNNHDVSTCAQANVMSTEIFERDMPSFDHVHFLCCRQNEKNGNDLQFTERVNMCQVAGV